MTENKGLFAMFGGSAPQPKPVFTKAADIKSKEELAKEAAIAAKASAAAKAAAVSSPSAGGGAWKTAKTRGSRGLALKARAYGKSVTVAENKTVVPEFDPEDIAMGGMGKKKKR